MLDSKLAECKDLAPRKYDKRSLLSFFVVDFFYETSLSPREIVLRNHQCFDQTCVEKLLLRGMKKSVGTNDDHFDFKQKKLNRFVRF